MCLARSLTSLRRRGNSGSRGIRTIPLRPWGGSGLSTLQKFPEIRDQEAGADRVAARSEPAWITEDKTAASPTLENIPDSLEGLHLSRNSVPDVDSAGITYIKAGCTATLPTLEAWFDHERSFEHCYRHTCKVPPQRSPKEAEKTTRYRTIGGGNPWRSP